MKLAPLRKLILFWLSLIAGLLVGSQWAFPSLALVFILVIWFILLTSGEVWLHLSLLGYLSDRLISIRDIIVDRIFLILPEPHGSLVTGIIFGNQVKLDQDLISNFRTVGLTYIIAVSGRAVGWQSASIDLQLALWLVLPLVAAIIIFLEIANRLLAGQTQDLAERFFANE